MDQSYSDHEPSRGGAFGSFGKLNLSINGVGVQYPPYLLDVSALPTIAARHYPDTPAMKKVLAINQFTGIETRSSIGPIDHPLANQACAPTIDELCSAFKQYAVPLAVSAAQKALSEANISPSDITHIVSTTCTNSANPGFDHYVAKGLGIKHTVQKSLLHGIGCSGGLAALRTAAELALGSTYRGRKARILVIAAEISSLLVRSELDSIDKNQETRIGAALFSDCASAVVLSNGIGASNEEESVYDLLGWDHRMIPDTEEDLGFDAHPLGWKVILSPRVPKLAASVVEPTFSDLISSLPDLPEEYRSAPDFDWALHPGGATILSGVERAMSITAEHQRASYDTYINHGNSSSATIFSVLHRLRQKDMDEVAPGGKAKDFVVGCAFGPGINIEMCMLKRNMNRTRAYDTTQELNTGLVTPPETESEGSRSEGEGEAGDSLSEALNGVELD